MPQLDVSDIILDPLFLDTMAVTRRAEVVNTFGEETTPSNVTTTFSGVLVPVSPDDLVRDPDGQITRKTIRIVTQYRLQAATPGFQADLIQWHGNSYVVIEVEDWTGYGHGFVQVTCASEDLLAAQQTQPEPI